jgi:UDP-2,3-diacylglucosamine hydrolase
MKQIKEGALFVADAHYPHHGDDFLRLLQRLGNGELEVPQLFLMGDNFDLLFGYNDYIKTFSAEAITLLQQLSEKMEIHYFEGNHDFCLSDIFENINIYPREKQPARFSYAGKRVGISHGDRYMTGAGYDLYCNILRNRLTLTLLRPFEKQIIDHRMGRLSRKNICHDFEGFEQRAGEILRQYGEVDLVIEGHFHQARKIGRYISLPSLACQGEVAFARDGQIVFERV